MIRYRLLHKPKTKNNVPYKPKKCIGLLLKRPTKVSIDKSRKPLINLSHPNFVTPYFLGRCSTTFSPIFLKPAHFASTGILRCISPYTSMLFTTFFLYAFKPQL